MKTLIVPTIREKNIKEFLQLWKPLDLWDEVIIVEDNPNKTFSLDAAYTHLCWQDITEQLEDKQWIISRRDSAIRSFGFLIAYNRGAEYFYTLDDDCLPYSTPKTFFDRHLESIQNNKRWTESIPGMRTRGLPYKNLGKLETIVLNMGLWSNVPDLDAIQTLSTPKIEYFNPPVISYILPKNQYAPICGMNMCFKREIAPLSYFPLMGENSPYRRFDDIWFGIILKKICDHLDLQIKIGTPFVNHSRASDPFVNLIKEAPGISTNETFWQVIDEVKLTASTPTNCMAELGEVLKNHPNTYIAQLGEALVVWAGLFK